MGYKIKFKLSKNITPSANSDDNVLSFSGENANFVFRFVSVRSKKNEVTIGSTTNQTYQHLTDSFDLDYGFENFSVSTKSDNTFSIIANNNNLSLPVLVKNTTGGAVDDVEIIYETETFKPFVDSYLSDSQFKTLSPHIKANNRIMSYYDIDYVDWRYFNSIEYEQDIDKVFKRGDKDTDHLFSLKDEYGNPSSVILSIPKLFLKEDIGIKQQLTPSGMNIYVVADHYALDLKYSIDGVNFKDSNLFTGLSKGQYTISVRCQFGQEHKIDIDVDYSEATNEEMKPYAYISKSNSIRLKEIEQWDDCSIKKNNENTLSCEIDGNLKYKEIQLFNTCDVIPTQIKTNYEPSVFVNDVQIPINKVNENIGLSEMLDAETMSLENGNTAIYFLSGYMYDPKTGNKKSEHKLLGQLPEWGVVGGIITIDDVMYVIDNVFYHDEIGAWCLEIVCSDDYINQSIIVSATYNREVYNVFEFYVDFSNYKDTEVSVSLVLDHKVFKNKLFVSETINVKEKHKNTILLDYKNINNTDVVVGEWGHRLRLNIASKYAEPSNKVEKFKTDTSIMIYDMSNYEVDVFVLSPVTEEMMRKIVLALSHQIVVINGLSYVKEDIEVEHKGSRIYVITAKMKRNNDSTHMTEDEYSQSSTIGVPNLIKGSIGGFISY